MSFAGASCSLQYCSAYVYSHPQTAKLGFKPCNELLTNFPTVDFSLESDLLWAHVNTGAANLLSLLSASILYDHK